MSKNILTRSRKQKALKALSTGQLAEAVRLFTWVCQTDPTDTDAWQRLSAIHGQMGNFEGVMECCQRILALDPNNVTAHSHLGNVHTAGGRLAEAIAAYEMALQLDPSNLDAQTNLGALYFREGKLDDAIDIWQKVIQHKPDHVESLKNLATAYLNQGRFEEALDISKRALTIMPKDSELHCMLGKACVRLGKSAGAIQAYHEALRHTSKTSRIYAALGAIATTMGELEQASQYYESAIKEDPTNIGALSGRADVYYRLGESDKAHQQIRVLLDAGNITPSLVIQHSQLCQHYDECDEVISRGKQLLAGKALTRDDQVMVHFALGKVLDSLARYDEAFQHYQDGNRLVEARYEHKQHEDMINSLIAVFAQDSRQYLPRANNQSERPVFIVGMPRSGTSLVEQILASHPNVHGAGELSDIIKLAYQYIPFTLGLKEPYPHCVGSLTQNQIDQCAQKYLARIEQFSSDAVRITDKMPQNFLYLGLIGQLFPRARIIHCSRHPLDTALSIYFQQFIEAHTYSFDLENIGHYYNEYRRLMQHWKNILDIPILDISYQNLVEDFEGTCRRMVGFLDLEWDERCLQFHRSERKIATASFDQVRSPIYSSSLGRWKHYERHLGPLIRVLKEDGPAATIAAEA